LEINTLPGLNPAVSDLCMMAAAEGTPYPVLISEILYLAAERNGLHFQAGPLTRRRSRSRARVSAPAVAAA
jgi:hypothetical protein